jgi:hypothetical protein
MSAPEKPGSHGPQKDAFVELASQIFVALAGNAYGTPGEHKKPDPKLLAAFSFKLAEAFEQASKETDRAKAAITAANKAAVKLDEVDLSAMFAASHIDATKPKT